LLVYSVCDLNSCSNFQLTFTDGGLYLRSGGGAGSHSIIGAIDGLEVVIFCDVGYLAKFSTGFLAICWALALALSMALPRASFW